MDQTTDSDKRGAPPKYEDTEGGAYAEGGAYTDGEFSQTHTLSADTTHTATLSVNKDYIKTIPGILKIVEVVTSLICFITTIASNSPGDGWCYFVAGSVFFISLVWFFFYLFNLVGRIHPISILIEWIYYLVLAICFFIAVIVAIAMAAQGHKALGAYAFFGLVCCAALFVDLYFQFKVWRTHGVSSYSRSTTVTTSTAGHTTASTEVRY